jgi:hypothetical protein
MTSKINLWEILTVSGTVASFTRVNSNRLEGVKATETCKKINVNNILKALNYICSPLLSFVAEKYTSVSSLKIFSALC